MISYLLTIFLLWSILPLNKAQWKPCIELKQDLLVPCKCAISMDYPRLIEMDCDQAIFTRDTMNILHDQPIVSISQRNCGYQTLPEELINSGLNLRKLDLSSNMIYRLMDRVLQLQSELLELRLADNLLGDSLNPIFSSNGFHNMEKLKILDLSRNGLKSIEGGILKGCTNLEELYLDGNNLTVVPTASLKGPYAIKVLSLARNNIGFLPRDTFITFRGSLLRLDLSYNELSYMEDNALSDLQHLLFLNISHNSLSRFNSDVFKNASTMSNISSTDDTLIISIIGGVVAFIAIIVSVICICRLRWSSQMQETRMATIGASIIPEESMMPETSIIRPTSAYSSKINHHDLYIGSYNNNSTLERGGNGSMLLTTPVQMMPYTQSIHMMHAMNPSSFSLSTQQIYDNPPLPIYVMENKIDRQLM